MATDLYYMGQNLAGFYAESYAVFQNTQIKQNYSKMGTISQPCMRIYFGNSYDVRSFSKLNVAGNIAIDTTCSKHYISIRNEGDASLNDQDYSSSVSSISIDIAQLTTILAGFSIYCAGA